MNPRKLMVLGSTGMLGHKLVQTCSSRFETIAVSRSRPPAAFVASLPSVAFETGVDAEDTQRLADLLRDTRPDAVVNCVGIVKQLAAAKDPVPSIKINSLLPHQLAAMCSSIEARLIHVSTDCVFKGTRGNYVESDAPDAEDLYGRTKLLGEVTGPGCLTLRTSIIGRELRDSSGLVEWFLSTSGETKGYADAWFSGLTTNVLAGVISDLVADSSLEGLWHVSAGRISKFELLHLIAKAFEIGTRIVEDHAVVIDRSLDSSRFRRATGFEPPSWPDMITALSQDTTDYEALRRS